MVTAAAVLGFGCKSNTINATTNNDSTTFTVGPDAMIYSGPNGSSLGVPANAVTANLQVTISSGVTDAPPLGSGMTSAGPVFQFAPEGTTFAAPVTVTVPYTTSGSNLVLLTAEESDTSWTVVPTSGSQPSGALQGATTHFSYYTVASAGGTTADAGIPSDSGVPACTPVAGNCMPDAGGTACPKGQTCMGGTDSGYQCCPAGQ